MGRDVQSLRARLGFVALVWLLGVGAAAFCYTREPWPSLAHPAIRATAIWAVLCWALAAIPMLLAPRDAWLKRTDDRLVIQASWLAAWLALVVHVVVAFQLGHGWSHAAAVEHTARTAGVGEGIIVNYAFVLLWGVDLLWLLVRPGRYATRPRWVGWTLHGFLAFVTFNATVVYGAGLARWLGVAVFALLVVLGGRRLRS